MRYLMAILIFILIPAVIEAQDAPLPTEPPITFDPAQDFQIKWNSGAWQTLIVDTVSIAVEAAPKPENHLWWGGLGLQTWKFLEESTDTADPARVVTITFNIDSLSSWWGYYEFRARKRAEQTGQVGMWGAPTWSGIIIMGNPGQPIKS